MKLFKKLMALALTAALALTLLAGCSGSSADTPEQLVMNRINAHRKLYGREAIRNNPELKRLGEEILETVTSKGEKYDLRQDPYVSSQAIAAMGDQPVYLMDLEQCKQLLPSAVNRIDGRYPLTLGDVLDASMGTMFLVGESVCFTQVEPGKPEAGNWKMMVTWPFESKMWESEIDKGMSVWSMLDKVGFATKEVDGSLRYIILVEVT